jgi:DNA-binding transcriptional MerR regulator
VAENKPELPDRLYFKIGEVAKIVGVKPYVLRYWETEFSMIRPGKTRSRHRLYRRRDVETLLEIKRLLHTERYTIEGAKRHLKTGGKALPGMAKDVAREAKEHKEHKEQMSLPLGERTYREALLRLKHDVAELYKLLA